MVFPSQGNVFSSTPTLCTLPMSFDPHFQFQKFSVRPIRQPRPTRAPYGPALPISVILRTLPRRNPEKLPHRVTSYCGIQYYPERQFPAAPRTDALPKASLHTQLSRQTFVRGNQLAGLPPGTCPPHRLSAMYGNFLKQHGDQLQMNKRSPPT